MKPCILWGSWGFCAHNSRVQQQRPLTYLPSASPRRMCWESHATLGADWSQPQRILSYRARPSASVHFCRSSGGSSSYWAVAVRFFTLKLFLTPPLGVWRWGRSCVQETSRRLTQRPAQLGAAGARRIEARSQKSSWISAVFFNHSSARRYYLCFHDPKNWTKPQYGSKKKTGDGKSSTWKNLSNINQKSFVALMRWFFRRVHIEEYCQS